MKVIFAWFLVFVGISVQAQVGKESNAVPATSAPRNAPASEESREAEEQQVAPNVPLKEMQKASQPMASEKSASVIAEKQVLDQQFNSNLVEAKRQMYARTPSPEQQKGMQETIEFYRKNFPNSFEYHFFSFAASGYNLTYEFHLLEAKRQKPKNIDVLKLSAQVAWIKQANEALRSSVDQLVATGALTRDMLTYDSLLLRFIPRNGILLTHGFGDGVGTKYLQLNGYRDDLSILSLDLMQSPQYRVLLQQQGFRFPAQTEIIDDRFFAEFLSLNSQRPLYVSMTFPQPYLERIQNQLSIAGLSFYYGLPKTTWNPASFVTNQQVQRFVTNTTSLQGKQLLANLLPVCWLAREAFRNEGNRTKMSEVDALIDRIALKADKLTVVESWRKSVQ